jgi:hypothetical protein
MRRCRPKRVARHIGLRSGERKGKNGDSGEVYIQCIQEVKFWDRPEEAPNLKQ